MAQGWKLWASHYLVCFLCFLAAETCTADRACKSLPETPLQYSPFLYLLRLSGECVISSVLSHHNKNLKWRMLKPSDKMCLSPQTDRVTALSSRTDQCYSSMLHLSFIYKTMENISLRREGMPTQKMWRGERDPWPSDSSFYMFFSSPWACSSQEGCLFHLRFSLWSLDLPLFYFCGLFPSLSFSHRHFGLLFPILTT